MSISALEKLSQILDFDPDDLEANREGYLSERQMLRVRKAAETENQDFTFGLIFIIIPFLFGCGFCAFFLDIPTIIGAVDYLVEIILLVFGLVGLGVLWGVWQSRHTSRMMREGRLFYAEGILALAADEKRARPRYYLLIGTERFRIPWRLHEAFQNYDGFGHAHRLYFVPGMRYVLSLEPLEME